MDKDNDKGMVGVLGEGTIVSLGNSGGIVAPSLWQQRSEPLPLFPTCAIVIHIAVIPLPWSRVLSEKQNTASRNRQARLWEELLAPLPAKSGNPSNQSVRWLQQLKCFRKQRIWSMNVSWSKECEWWLLTMLVVSIIYYISWLSDTYWINTPAVARYPKQCSNVNGEKRRNCVSWWHHSWCWSTSIWRTRWWPMQNVQGDFPFILE